jgi:tetratricopeptide (TPR) repeat protein
VLADRGDIDAAVAELRLAIRLRPDSINTYLAIGEILGAASRHEEALEAYRQAAELEPQNSVVHSRMGVTHGMLGQIDQAIGHYEHALRLRPSATVHANLGLAYFTADQLENALAHFQAAVKLDPRGAAYHRSMGDVLRRLTRTAEAQREYHQAIGLANEALAVKSRDASSVVLIALCEANLGRRAAAERRAAEALVLAPQNREVVFRVAKAYAIAGNTAKAFEHLSLAIALGYVAQVARMDPELKSLRGAEFERAIAAGLERGRS